MNRVGDMLPSWLAAVKRRLDAGELVDDEAVARWEQERQERRKAERQRWRRIQEGFLSPRHVADAKRILSGELRPLSAIYRALRQQLRKNPAASVLLVGDTGSGKTTAATAYGLSRIQAGWTVRHRQASRWASVAKSEEALEELERVDLLILDELHRSLPAWAMTTLLGVIDERHQHKRQTIGILTAPDVEGILGLEVVERFDAVLTTAEKSWRKGAGR